MEKITLEGPVRAQCPALANQLHPRTTVVLDEAAAAELQNSAYYRYTWEENKPHRQGL
ncbi:hypothetical protein [Arthrobacter oryzae]|uniref:hypothetical protein n=1 Tax=Arthrobacter oryzae TaxID=409290 RepID=UPI00273C0D8C|nr:hypothetical protein [Arthrobacter oryzae]WLQ05714.1 hypothetical protein Q8Z05_16590 [Arthrobacter oryzae]